MKPRLAKTVTGIGDDGKSYTIRGYKQMRREGDGWIEEALISLIQTSEGEDLFCESEDPLVFWNPKTGMKIHCDQSWT